MKKSIFIFLTGIFFVSTIFAASEQLLDKVVAVVNDNVITSTDLNEQVLLVKKQLAQRHIGLPKEKALRLQVLRHMIDVDLQLQLARQNDITVMPDEVDTAISDIAKRSNMRVAQLKKSILSSGLSWQQYRKNVEKEMRIARVQQKAVAQDITVTQSQVQNFINANKQREKKQYHLKDIVLSLPEAPSPEQVSQAKKKTVALMALLKKGKDFSTTAIERSSGTFALGGGDLGFRLIVGLPDIFAKEVVSMNVGNIRGPLRAPNGFHIIKLVGVKGDIAKHNVALTHVQHILIKKAIGETDKEVKDKLLAIKAQMKKGKSFSALAQKYSVDVVSAKKGGDLGWVHKGELVAGFEKAMNKLPVGQVSAPVKSGFGYHLIKVLARKNIDNSIVYQQKMVRQKLYERKFAEAVQNWQQELRAQAYIKIMI